MIEQFRPRLQITSPLSATESTASEHRSGRRGAGGGGGTVKHETGESRQIKLGRDVGARPATQSGGSRQTQIDQGWPKSRAKFSTLIGIISQKPGPSLALWANPVKLTLQTSVTVCRKWSLTLFERASRSCG